MEITGSYTVSQDISTVISLSSDMTKIAPCLKGVTQVEKLTPENLIGRIKVSVGIIKGTFDLNATVKKLSEDSIELMLKLKGTLGTAEGIIVVKASNLQGKTQLTWKGDVELKGLAANIGKSLVEQVSNSLVEEIYKCLFR